MCAAGAGRLHDTGARARVCSGDDLCARVSHRLALAWPPLVPRSALPLIDRGSVAATIATHTRSRAPGLPDAAPRVCSS